MVRHNLWLATLSQWWWYDISFILLCLSFGVESVLISLRLPSFVLSHYYHSIRSDLSNQINWSAIMPHFISIHALFVLMDIVSSGLVDQSLRVRQAPNPDPLQYCGMKVELGGCPYECVQGKCPCYSYCADGPQVCGLANDPLQIAVYTYCVSCQFLPIVKIETLFLKRWKHINVGTRWLMRRHVCRRTQTTAYSIGAYNTALIIAWVYEMEPGDYQLIKSPPMR